MITVTRTRAVPPLAAAVVVFLGDSISKSGVHYLMII
jgi:hypothetical protein